MASVNEHDDPIHSLKRVEDELRLKILHQSYRYINLTDYFFTGMYNTKWW